MMITNWLNQNNGLIMTSLTAIYVITTCVILRTMRKTNEIAQKSLDNARELERSRVRPYVIFDIVAEDRCFYAVLRNIGMTPALKVRTTTTPEIKKCVPQYASLCFIQEGVALLAPGQEIRDLIDTTPSYLQKNRDVTYEVNIEYGDVNGQQYKEKSMISVEHHRDRLSGGTKDPVAEIPPKIEMLARNVSSLAESQQELVWILEAALNPWGGKHNSHDSLPLQGEDIEYPLSPDQTEYFLNVISSDRRGRIYCGLLTNSTGEEAEKYRAFLEDFVSLGLMRKERDYFTPTLKGFHYFRKLSGAQTEEKADQ